MKYYSILKKVYKYNTTIEFFIYRLQLLNY